MPSGAKRSYGPRPHWHVADLERAQVGRKAAVKLARPGRDRLFLHGKAALTGAIAGEALLDRGVHLNPQRDDAKREVWFDSLEPVHEIRHALAHAVVVR